MTQAEKEFRRLHDETLTVVGRSEALTAEVRGVQAAHPGWSFDRSFQHVMAENGTTRFVKVPTGSRLAQASQDDGTDFPADDGTGFRNSMKRLAKEHLDSASPDISLIPSKHRSLISRMVSLMAANPGWSMDQALSKVLELNPELGDREDGSAAARHAAVGGVRLVTADHYADDWYH